MTTTLHINLKAVQDSIDKIKTRLTNNCKICAIIKANAYGLNSERIADEKYIKNIDYFGVVTLEEAKSIRKKNNSTPILLLTEVSLTENEYALFKHLSIIPTIYSLSYAEKMERLCNKEQIELPFHYKINTGMNRFGSDYEIAITLLNKIEKECPHLKCEGLFTHLADSENSNSQFTKEQMEKFKVILPKLKPENKIVHAANSGGIINYPESHFDMVRPGLLLYENALSLSTTILHIRHVKKGEPIGYENKGIAPNDTQIAVIGIGYSHGMPMNTQTLTVLINGQHYPFIGKVCMDFSMIDLKTNPDNITIDNTVTVIGKSKESIITLAEFCDKTGEPMRKFLCGLSPRLKRNYID